MPCFIGAFDGRLINTQVNGYTHRSITPEMHHLQCLDKNNTRILIYGLLKCLWTAGFNIIQDHMTTTEVDMLLPRKPRTS